MKNKELKYEVVNDFPRDGVKFADITSILIDPEQSEVVQRMLDEQHEPKSYDYIVGVEARGFVFAAVAAFRHKVPLVLARKSGKLPNPVFEQEYRLEYGTDSICLQKKDIIAGKNYLIIDDVIASGGTITAVAAMIIRNGGLVVGLFAPILISE